MNRWALIVTQVLAPPWLTVAETKTMFLSELDVGQWEYSLASQGHVLPPKDAIGKYLHLLRL